MSDSIRVNGNVLSWASLGFKIDGDRYYGFKSINFAEALEQVLVHGMGRHYAPRARTAGKYTPEPIKLMGEVNSLKIIRGVLAAQAADQRSYGTVEFECFLEGVEAEQTITAEFLRCKWAKNTGNFEETPEALYEEIELSTMQIVRDGLTLFNATEGSP